MKGCAMKKYEKVFQKDYKKWHKENHAYKEQVRQDKDRLHYHLMPETGWLNDPNGLCQFHGTYHIYYQFTPFEPTGELKLWGHYTTKDFIHFQNEEPVLFPDTEYDAHGVYSGSAFVEKDLIHYFYTGNVKYFDRDDYDYIMKGRGSNVVHVTSRDGRHMSEKELQLTNADYPSDMSAHVRDPKVFQKDGSYYMVLGGRDQNSKGLVLLYQSEDLEHWNFVNKITTKETFGYMWECPDLFEADGQMMLICCPQGVETQGINYENVHQCTAMKIKYDFQNHSYEIAEGKEIQQVDRGFDFYAPQTFEDEKGRRILIGWMGIPDADYTNPTVERGWQHALTIPRQLHVKDGHLCQQPIEELKALRKGKAAYDFSEKEENNKWSHPTAEEGMEALCYEAAVNFQSCQNMVLTLRQGVTLSYQEGIMVLDLGEHGSGRTTRSVAVSELNNLRIYSDTSSLEIFVNDGAEVFTTRVYGHQPEISISGSCRGTAAIYGLQPVEVAEPDNKLCAIGEALIDFIPSQKGQRLKDVTAFTRVAGGAPANVAGAVSKLGGQSKVLTKLGADPFGDYIQETLDNIGIDTSQIKRDKEGETALAFVSLAADGNREFKFYRKNSADLRFTPEDISEDVLDDCGMIHFCSVDLVESSMKQAHRKLIQMAVSQKKLVSFDPNLRFSLWDDLECLKQTVNEFMEYADIIKISDEELEFITGYTNIEEALPELFAHRAKYIVYTMGGDGAAVYTRQGKVTAPGYRVAVRDTTGAGDSFIGAFLYCILNDRVTDLEKVSEDNLKAYLKFANAYAAYTTTKEGALDSMAWADEMDAWIGKIEE